MKNIIFIFLILINLPIFSQCPADDCEYSLRVFAVGVNFCQLPPYRLAFEDNFDSTRLDSTKWNPKTGVVRDPTYQTAKQWYSPKNLIVESGMLRIISKRDTLLNQLNESNGTYSDFYYSSGEIDSQKSFGFGLYEIRCKVPNGNGLWPAFWMFGGAPSNPFNAIIANEIDVFEFVNTSLNNPNEIEYDQTTLHLYEPNSVASCQTPCGGVKSPNFDFSQWHEFSLDWEPTEVRWYVDNTLIRTDVHYALATGPNNPLGNEACSIVPTGVYWVKDIFPDPAIPVNIIANVAIQNGLYTPTANVLPNEMDIDYIRFYASLADSLLNQTNYIEFSIYPNPGTTEVTIETSDSKPYNIQILNMLGEVVEKMQNLNNNPTNIYIGNLAKGIYFIQVQDAMSGASSWKKFMKL